MTDAERTAFVLANTAIRPVPHAPALSLRVADEAVPLWQRTEEELQASGLEPPFWAFAWAGGQGLARWLLDHPAAVAGRTVLDVASGSGLVGIAAMRAGAARATCVDIDPFAAAAAAENAALNGVAVEARTRDPIGMDREALGSPDLVLAGDVHYDRALANAITPWLEALAGQGARVLVGDPGRAYFPRERDWTELARHVVPVTRALEDAEIRSVGVWEVTAPR